MKKTLYFVLIAAITFISGCSKEDDPNNNNNNNNQFSVRDGFYTSTATPKGNAFTWPSGISVVQNFAAAWNPSTDPGHFVGNGEYVPIEVTLRNNTASAISIVFPAKLVLTSNDPDYQNGITLQAYTITIPAMQDWIVTLNMFCMNEHDGSPSGDAIPFSNPLVSSNTDLDQLVSILANKKKDWDYNSSDYYTHSDIIQTALWHVCQTGQLDANDLTQLNALPN